MKAEIAMLIGFVILVSGCVSETQEESLKTFASAEEIVDFIKNNEATGSFYAGVGAERMAIAGAAEAAADKAEDFSTTNIQVAGVDEADFVKNDGKYIYKVSGSKIIIADVFPPENMRIISEIDLPGNAIEIFINNDRLVVFGNIVEQGSPQEIIAGPRMIAPLGYAPYYSSKTFVNIYDISDRERPVIFSETDIDGEYFDSRMIGDYIYAVINQPVKIMGDEIILPRMYAAGAEKNIMDYTDINYFDVPGFSYRFTSIMSFNVNEGGFDIEVYLMDETNNMFVSASNIYVTYQARMNSFDMIERMLEEVFYDFLPDDVRNEINMIRNSDTGIAEKIRSIDSAMSGYFNSLDSEGRMSIMRNMQERMADFQEKLQKELERSIVHRIAIDNGKIEYSAQGDFPGRVLNQFSMDEYNGYFRVATTVGNEWDPNAKSSNDIYVLDMDLNIVGKVEGLGRGERLHSARFIGDRAYLVTFKKIDPFFVVSLEDPLNPRVLGELKIPGFSDYLHPYDENHIIGFGKETVEAQQELERGFDFAWYQGIKMSLFDVSDVNNPVEKDKLIIGDRGSDSYILSDHKALLFSRERNLLVIPITLAEIDEEQYQGEVPDTAYGRFVFQGAYVIDISLDGFEIRGRITHADEEPSGGYYYADPYSVKRSIYMDDILYTVSDSMIMAHSLDNLEEISSLEMPYDEPEYQPLYIDVI